MLNLNEPVPLRCGAVLPGRTALAPMTNRQSHDDGTLSDDEYHWLLRRAEGGFALTSTCAAFVCEEGKAWPGQLGIADDGHLPGLTRLATALNATGTVSIVQLHHGGKRAKLAPGRRLSASEDAEYDTRAAEPADLDRLVHRFTEAAVRAERAGFSGVEVHGANGYVFTQFLSPTDNRRTDDYGGSLENRARLLRRTVQAIRARVGSGFVVGVRISPVDVGPRWGLTLADSCRLSAWLVEDGVDFIHLSLGDAAASPPFEDETRPVARVIREAIPESVPVVAAGGIGSAADAKRALDAGVEVLSIGRAAIVEPDWPRQVSMPGWLPTAPPWTRERLAEVAVSDKLWTYLTLFPGLTVDSPEP